MKGKMRKLFAFALAAIMVLAMGITASAQTVGSKSDNTATITINNASKGETYKVYKLFDASVTGTEGGSIAYTGDIPSALADYFTKDTAGNISPTEVAGTKPEGSEVLEASEGLKTALKTWTESEGVNAVAQAVSDGSVLEFAGLSYGYYVVTTTQGAGTLTVTSTNPSASVFDKNTTVPTVPEDGKKVDNDNVYIGQTVTYTLKFTTSNYEGSGKDAKQIVSYTVEDTLPSWLTEVTVTGITIKGAGENGSDLDYKVDNDTPQFVGKAITIPWVNETSGASLYRNGTEVVITYTAKVTYTDDLAIAGQGNANTFTLKYNVKDGDTPKEPDKSTSTETISTYALVIKKVDQSGQPLKGATFSVQGLQTSGDKGDYTVAGLTAAGAADTVMSTDDEGILIVKGVAAGTYNVTEVAAPAGYNKLTDPVPVEATKTTETTTDTTTYLDSEGNVVGENTENKITVNYTNDELAASVLPILNKTGNLLPSTGGIGTTIFYVVGGILVVAAGVLLITKKRMSKEQ